MLEEPPQLDDGEALSASISRSSSSDFASANSSASERLDDSDDEPGPAAEEDLQEIGLEDASLETAPTPLPSSLPEPADELPIASPPLALSASTSSHQLDSLPPSLPERSTPISTPISTPTPRFASRSSSSFFSKEPLAGASTGAHVWGVCLVAFDHAIGPTVEFAYPEALQKNEDLNKTLPFLALPDGAHTREEDYSYFHLLLPSIAPDTIFGISCNRQIPTSELTNKGKGVTRSTVQKAIVVLASKPIFGPLRDKLGVITRAFFAQKNFDDKSILVDLYSSLEIPVEAGGNGNEEDAEDEAQMYMGTSLRELVYKFRNKTLMLVKLLMLQRRVMFYAQSTPVESLCTFQYSLVALIPSLLTNLDDSASPTLDERSKRITRPMTLKTSDRSSLIRYLGLPLNIFGEGSFFQPYLPLQQIDLLKNRSFLVGTTNSIFQQQRDCKIDVIVNIESASLEILDAPLASLLALTAADRKWMDEIVTTVDNSWNAEDPSRPLGLNFVGSDDFLRAKFEEYICSLLACIKFTDFLAKGERGNVLISGTDMDTNGLSSFNEGFVRAFKATPAFELWDRTTDSVIFDLVEPRHPMEGKTNPIEDVGIRLAHGLHDLRLEENLGPTREAIARGLTTGSESLWKTYTSLRSDFSKRQLERREAEASPTSSNDFAPPPLLATTVLAGVDVAKTGAASLATGIGSFLSSKRSLLFAPSPTDPTPSSPTFGSFFNSPSSPAATAGASVSGFFSGFGRKVSETGKRGDGGMEGLEELGPITDLDLEWKERKAREAREGVRSVEKVEPSRRRD